MPPTRDLDANYVVNGMSVDVEDYFHVSAFADSVDRRRWDRLESRVRQNTERLLILFARADIRATFFVLGWVADRHPDLVRRIAAAGHEIASHGYSHRLVYEQTPDQFREDIRRARYAIEAITSAPVLGYRAPSYSITARSRWALEVLAEEGYQYDASIYPIRHDRYGIPDSPRHPYPIETPAGTLWEMPASTVRIGRINLPIGGGGYFRILPYQWTQWGIRRLNLLERRPAIFYLHPWEIDPEQPRLPGSAFSRFRHYSNLQRTEARMIRLCEQFRFGPMCELLASVVATTRPASRLLSAPGALPSAVLQVRDPA
jgi:polysaccharide deacetylase family protein (PEP-CTERM system associated)